MAKVHVLEERLRELVVRELDVTRERGESVAALA